MDAKIKFYQSTWFVVLMLVFCFPVGIFLVWKYDKFGSKKTKIIVTIVAMIWGFMVYLLSWGDDGHTPKGNYYTINPETGRKETLDGQPYIGKELEAEIEKNRLL